MPRIPATIITGFLGAGKTSLVRHLVEHAEGRRIALLINEFGELGIDRELLLGCGIAGCRAEDRPTAPSCRCVCSQATQRAETFRLHTSYLTADSSRLAQACRAPGEQHG